MKNKSLLKNSKLGEVLRSREASLLLVMILLVAVIQWRSGGKFLSGNVIYQMTQNYAYTAVLALGMLCAAVSSAVSLSLMKRQGVTLMKLFKRLFARK